jgi:putative CocE/NonD family hydrolase
MKSAAIRDRRAPILALATGIALATLLTPLTALSQDRVSAFGRYSGYSEASYDGWNRHSEYVPMLDGVMLAVNYFLPTRGGQEASEPLPVILVYTRYLRAWEEGDRIVTVIDQYPFLQELLRHGYALAVVNARGTGASFGIRNGVFSAAETADSYEIVEWLAAQEWCDGHVGMWGRSYSGMTSYHAATQAPPHLDAIFAEMAGPIVYDLIYQGGTYKSDFIKEWSHLVKRMDRGILAPPARVDSDPDGTMRNSAVAEHADNFWPHLMAKKAKYRDWSTIRRNGATWSWDMASSIHGAGQIKDAGVPVYHLLGWYDMYATQQAIMYENLKSGRQRMTIGPWTHSGGFGGQIHGAEVRRWFDYWLKGINNGILREKPIHYYLMFGNNSVPQSPGRYVSQDEDEAEDGSLWLATKRWPPRVKTKKYFFRSGPSDTVDSANDGRLLTAKPGAAQASDPYKVDYSSSVGSFSRWMDGYGAERNDPPGTTFFDERTSEDEKALTYTSDPLAQEQAIVGYPIVHLWVTSTHNDEDFFVYLEEVDAQGNAHLIT